MKVRSTEEARYYTNPDTGEEYPSVTTILSVIDKSAPLIRWAVKQTCDFIESKTSDGMFLQEAVTLARKEAARQKSEAADIGTLIHNAVEEWATATAEGKAHFVYFEEPRLAKAWSAFEKFVEQYEITPLRAEMRVIHKKRKYGGTIDLVVQMRAKPMTKKATYILDVKSSNHFLEIPYGPQVAAYSAMFQSKEYDGIGVVRLDKNTGEPHFYDLTEKRKEYLDVFKEAHALWLAMKRAKGGNK